MVAFRAFVTAAAGALAFTASARAADMPQRVLPIQTVAIEEVSGWYLRGDIGYRSSTTIKSAVVSTGVPSPTDNRLDDSFWGGVGAGFKWGHIRTDVTADYGAEATYTGTIGAASATARIQTITGLANIYYDIGTWACLTPYLGVGAGVAAVRVSEYHSAAIPPLSNVGSFGRTNFAWALMAGVNYQFLPNLSVDVGYRFLDLGDAKTATDISGDLTLSSLQSHEVRVGLRWMYNTPWAYAR